VSTAIAVDVAALDALPAAHPPARVPRAPRKQQQRRQSGPQIQGCLRILEKSFIFASPLIPAAAERGEQIHQRLQMEIIHLDQLVLRGEQRVFRMSTVRMFTVPADICLCANS